MTIEQIKKKLMTGDFVVIGKMLDITPDNARMRFRREKKDVVAAAVKLIESREALVNEHQLNQ